MAGNRWQDLAVRCLRAAVRATTTPARRRPSPTSRAARPSAPQAATSGSGPRTGTRGSADFRGVATVTYEPHPDGLPDPGEVVWTWVAFEEDPHHGKDRPVLVVGRDDPFLLALMLSSRDHEGPGSDEADEARHGRHWLDLGAGAWDVRGRPSQVRLDRVLRVDPSGVRREGATLDRDRFERVAQRLRADQGWS